MTVELSDPEMMRYNRQIVLRGFDFEGQEALKAASVLVVGLGGLGCAAAQYLAAAGAGSMTLLDFDTVSVSNLQRQTLHSDATVGQPKVESAGAALARINPHVQFTLIDAMLDDDALSAQIARHDLVRTAPITSPSVISSTRAVLLTKPRWSPARRSAWRGKSASSRTPRVNPATAA